MLLKSLMVLFFSVPAIASWTANIIVNVPSFTPKKDKVYITGNLEKLCDWRPDCLALKKIQPNTYKVAINLSDDISKFKFKITRGSYFREMSTAKGEVFKNQNFSRSKQNKELVVNVANWNDFGPIGRNSEVIRVKDFFSEELGYSKDISIKLPKDYNQSPNKYYPVIYMHDGQNLFDPYLASFGNVWGMDRVMEGFNGRKAILVGISSDLKRRYDEYDFERTGRSYANFIVNKVIPYINNNYRTLSDRANTFLMGSSMGALISLEILFSYPHIFSKAAGLSFPAFIHKRAVFRFLKSIKRAPQNVSYYMDHGTHGIDSKYESSAVELYSLLIEKGLSKKKLDYLVFPYADHTEIDWERRVRTPLAFLLR